MIENKYFIKKIFPVFLGLFFLISYQSYAQVTPDEPVNDTIKKYKGSLVLENPKSIVEAYTYNPDKNLYFYNNLFGEYNVAYPKVLTPKEYEDLVSKFKKTVEKFTEKITLLE